MSESINKIKVKDITYDVEDSIARGSAIQDSSLQITTTPDSVSLSYTDLEGETFEVPISTATTENAGVMSAEDKVKISAMFGNLKNQVINVQGNYVISLLPSILKTSYTLTELIKPQGAVVYLAVGSTNKLKITEDMLPYTLNQDYNGVSSSKGGTVSIIYSEEPIPQKGKVQELETLIDTNTAEIETLKTDIKTQDDDINRLDLSINGTIREISADGKKSYQAVALPVPLGKGYIITEMNASDAVVWLSKTGGNPDVKITELPLVLEAEYNFLLSNIDALISIRYTQGEEPKESIDKVVKNLEQRVDEAETSLTAVRKVIYVKKTDQDIELFLKMKQAFDEGYCDVIFECGTYTIKEAYKYMYEQYYWRDKNGLPLGDGCRYYFNGSTIVGENPTESAGVEISCNILDSVRRASSYEVHDVTLVNNVEDADNYKKTYCIHDESDGALIPYIRRFNNVRCVSKKRIFGCGTGFDSKIIIENCEFIHTEDVTAKLSNNIAIHGVISSMNPNNNFQQLRVSLLNCYFNNNSVPVHITSSTFTSDEDNVELKMVGCKCGSNLNDETTNVCNKLVQYNNDIALYQ